MNQCFNYMSSLKLGQHYAPYYLKLSLGKEPIFDISANIPTEKINDLAITDVHGISEEEETKMGSPNEGEERIDRDEIQTSYIGKTADKCTNCTSIDIQLPQQQEDDQGKEGDAEIDITLKDPEAKVDATKIQFGFIGHHQSRKKMKKAKDENGDHTTKKDETKVKGDGNQAINFTNPNIDEAATRVQAGYKGYKTRRNLNTITVEATSQEVSCSSEYDSEEEEEEEDDEKEGEEEENKGGKNEVEDIIDIDLNDQEIEMAATKIQPGFRGHQARQEVKEIDDDKANAVTEPKKKNTVTANQEAIDIDQENVKTEEVTTKIQAGFKGMKARKEVTKLKRQSNDQDKETKDKIKDGTEASKEDEEEINRDLTELQLEKAATKIQAGFKGHQTQKNIIENKGKDLGKIAKTSVANNTKEEDIDYDLTDPEVEKAATKIQASFKGHQTRKKLKKQKN